MLWVKGDGMRGEAGVVKMDRGEKNGRAAGEGGGGRGRIDCVCVRASACLRAYVRVTKSERVNEREPTVDAREPLRTRAHTHTHTHN